MARKRFERYDETEPFQAFHGNIKKQFVFLAQINTKGIVDIITTQ